MTPPSKKILVFGATGVIGKVLTSSLLNAGDVFDKVGIFTSAKTVEQKAGLIDGFKARGAQVIVGDANRDEDVLEAYKGYDTVVSAFGRSVIGNQISLIALAEKSPSIVRFFPSEYGTDIEYDDTSAGEVTHQQKIKVRAFIESDAVKSLAHTYLVTGPYADLYAGSMESEKAAGSFDAKAKEAVLLGDGEGPISLTTMADVGRLLVAALKNPEYCDNKAVKVNSFTTTPAAILAELERQTETRWKVSYTPLDELRAREKGAYESGNPLAGLYTLRRIWTEGRTLYDARDNEAIGVTKTDTLEMVVQDTIRGQVSAFQNTKL